MPRRARWSGDKAVRAWPWEVMTPARGANRKNKAIFSVVSPVPPRRMSHRRRPGRAVAGRQDAECARGQRTAQPPTDCRDPTGCTGRGGRDWWADRKRMGKSGRRAAIKS
jgi:hypothetical protein